MHQPSQSGRMETPSYVNDGVHPNLAMHRSAPKLHRTHLFDKRLHTNTTHITSVSISKGCALLSHIPQCCQGGKASFHGHWRATGLVRIFARSHVSTLACVKLSQDKNRALSCCCRECFFVACDGEVASTGAACCAATSRDTPVRELLLSEICGDGQLSNGATSPSASERAYTHRHAHSVTIKWLQSSYLNFLATGKGCRSGSKLLRPRNLRHLPQSSRKRSLGL